LTTDLHAICEGGIRLILRRTMFLSLIIMQCKVFIVRFEIEKVIQECHSGSNLDSTVRIP